MPPLRQRTLDSFVVGVAKSDVGDGNESAPQRELRSLRALIEMGFDAGAARSALLYGAGDVERAVARLLSQ